jgi:hypothetical protein
MKSSPLKQTGQRMQALRRSHCCTQDELSHLLRFHRAPISREILANWESGRTEVPAHWIPLIAHPFNPKSPTFCPTRPSKIWPDTSRPSPGKALQKRNHKFGWHFVHVLHPHGVLKDIKSA